MLEILHEESSQIGHIVKSNLGLALEILHEESLQIGLEINWSKTKLQIFDDTSTPPSKVSVLDHDVEVVDSFVYLGSCIDVHGWSEPDICRRITRP